ncbi:hypothetical protein Ait01nite_040820 [Actinoplanes italicus]|uniref:Uncharacterized protein n=1 Tax=Actinoplanes italicus TaxID=113567 RepID=A0A2T0K210_9ACTN|nr:hypothetical protein [Actinoplanes italicus]PRX16831.1 hypothetical protein CLV67_118162 [Actinoplanes italicus]GIE31037.1 hypothetical protein Ait01nite_040820 [Actinoplanes italicus]
MKPRAEAVEVCLEALATGRVHGFSPNHDPELLAGHAPFTQSVVSPHGMVRDWGLFEAHFTRWTPVQPWRCQFFMVQAHRMGKPPRWKRLLRELDGFELAPGSYTVPGSDYVRITASGSEACIDTDTGRVVKISVPATPPLTSADPPPQHLRRQVRDIATAPEGAWSAWLERRPPGEWTHHLAVLFNLHRDDPARRDTWTAFGLWLLRQVAGRTAADEWAWRWSEFVLDRPGTVPVGDVARVCLAALPMTPGEAAALPADWRSRTPETIRRSRMTLALLRFAAEDVPPPPQPAPGLTTWEPLLRHLG